MFIPFLSDGFNPVSISTLFGMFCFSIFAFISGFGIFAFSFISLVQSFFPFIIPEYISSPSTLVFSSGFSNFMFLFPEFNSVFCVLNFNSGLL